MKRFLLIIGLIVVLLTGSVAGITLYAMNALREPLTIDNQPLRLIVEPGSTLSRVAGDLADRNVLRNPRLLAWYGRLNGTATTIKVGEFDVPAGTTPIELLELLVAGDVVQYSFTIVEGWRFSELFAAIREHEAITISGVERDAVMESLGKPDIHPEGQFLPDTYHFPRGSSDIDVLARAHEALVAALEAAWAARSEDAVVASPYEALILASIIEKETGRAGERREISGVYTRRLQRGMRLQADPTVIYGLGEDWDGDIRRRDLQTDTPYNTYTRNGLPPTPIALAGAAAIDAAINPESGEALYFVATGEGDGSHYFSATLEEHNAAVQRYLARLRERSAEQ